MRIGPSIACIRERDACLSALTRAEIDLTRVTPIQSRDTRRWEPAKLKKKKYRYQRLFDCSMGASELNSPKETTFHSYRLKEGQNERAGHPDRTCQSTGRFWTGHSQARRGFHDRASVRSLRKVLESKVIASARRISNHFALT